MLIFLAWQASLKQSFLLCEDKTVVNLLSLGDVYVRTIHKNDLGGLIH